MSVVSFAIIFSHSKGCLFTLLIVSLAVQKLLLLFIFVYLFTFVFISITLRFLEPKSRVASAPWGAPVRGRLLWGGVLGVSALLLRLLILEFCAASFHGAYCHPVPRIFFLNR